MADHPNKGAASPNNRKLPVDVSFDNQADQAFLRESKRLRPQDPQEPADDPELLINAFSDAIGKCRGFRRSDVKDTLFDAWRYDGMHDPPKSGRRFSKVIKRVNFECGFAQNGFLVQVDLLDVPDEGLRAAIYVRSKEHPKGKNTANATFKFRWDRDANAYVVDFKSASVRQALANECGLPPYIAPVPSFAGRAAIGQSIDPSLAHNLVLLADFAAQVASGTMRIREPATFYPPAH